MTASDEPALATTPEKPVSAFFARVRPYVERVKANLDPISKALLIVWQLSLFLGVILFIIYFYSTGFLPELDFNASVTLLMTSALTGSFLIFWVFIILFLPGLMFVSRTKKDSVYFLFPVLSFIAILLIIMSGWSNPQVVWLVWPCIIALAVPIAVIRYIFVRNLLKSVLFPFHSIIAIQGFLVSFLVVNGLSASQHEVYFAIGMMIVFNTLLVVAPLAPGTQKYGLWSYVIIIAAVGPAIIMLWGLTFIPNATMRIYKFGHFQAASLVLAEKACEIAKDHGLSEGLPCHFSDVRIHSRLGSTYYIEGRKDKEPVCFTIPSSAVLSWSFAADKQPSEKEWRDGCNQSKRNRDIAEPDPSKDGQ